MKLEAADPGVAGVRGSSLDKVGRPSTTGRAWPSDHDDEVLPVMARGHPNAEIYLAETTVKTMRSGAFNRSPKSTSCSSARPRRCVAEVPNPLCALPPTPRT